MWASTETAIGTLSVRGRPRDAASLRVSVGRRVSSAELGAPGLSPTSILIVKAIRDPLPGKLLRGPNPLRASRPWERAVQEQLDRFYRSASRPARGRVAPNAEAVLFRDVGELLASLCLDAAEGTAVHHWWWRVVLAGLSSVSPPRVASLLVEEPLLLPAVLSQLDAWRSLERALATVTGPEGREVLEALVRVHELDLDLSSERPMPRSANRDSGLLLAEDVSGPDDAAATRQPPSETRAPWARWLEPRFSGEGSAERECLAGLAIALHRAPSRARSTTFLQYVHRWWRERHEQETHEDSTVPDSPSAPSPLVNRTSSVETSAPSSVSSAGARTSLWRRVPDGSRNEGDSATANLEFLDAETDIHRVLGTWTPPVEGVETELAGIFYLIHVMEWLGLPEWLESEVGAWSLLELIGKALLEKRLNDYERDPLWKALRWLDGRGADDPAASRLELRDYRVPRSWFSGAVAITDRFSWNATKTRLRLWSSRGFCVVEVPRDDRTAVAQARAELDFYSENVPLSYERQGRPPQADVSSLRRQGICSGACCWASLAGPYIRLRLEHALASSSPEAASSLLGVPGRVYPTSTHVDIVMGLDDISVPARLAGLDRDPGWRHRFGRVVLFHFR